MTSRSHRFAELTRSELSDRAQAALLVIPVGAVEQHGPHLPTGTDSFHATHVAEQSAMQAAASIDVIVAPTVSYGSSHHHLPFGATLSLRTETLYSVLMELGESARLSGFRKLFFLNGHGGNHEIAQLAARDLALEGPLHAGSGSWWAMAYQELVGDGAADGGRLPGHAGRFETAISAALDPDAGTSPPPAHSSYQESDRHAYSPVYRAEFHDSWRRLDGYTDSPGSASREDGQRWLGIAVEAVKRLLIEFSDAADVIDQRPSR